MSATVDINTNTEKNVLSIPIQSVTTREKKKEGDKDDESPSLKTEKPVKEEDIEEVVFVVEGDTARMIKVVTGIQDNEYIQVLEGLQADQEVITGPYSIVSRKLKNGLRVERKSEDEKKKEKEKEKERRNEGDPSDE
jgi:HlyD family secretion protein